MKVNLLAHVTAFVAGTILCGSAFAQQPIKIGYAADMSGACGSLVDGATKALRMGVEELNKRGGLIGRQIEVIERDTKTRPDEGAKEVRDLVVNHKVDVVTGVCSSAVLLAETAVSAEFKVPFYTAIGATQAANIDKWQPYYLQTQPNALMEAIGVAEFVARDKNTKRVSMFGFDYEYGHSAAKAFSERLRKLRPDIELQPLLTSKLGETNMTSYITALLAQKPDVVYSTLFGGGLVNFVKQGKSYGFFQQTTLLANMTIDFLEPLGQELPEGRLGGFSKGPFYAMLDNPKTAAFVDAYRARYKKYPDEWALLAYDGLMFYAEAVKQAKSTAPDDVMKAVTTIKYSGLRGDMQVRALDGQMNAPAWVGLLGKDPKYPFMVLKDPVRFDADKTILSEAEIKAGRTAAK